MAKSVEIRVNPAVLTWARETMGYSVEEASRKAGVGPDKLRAWELGRAFPSYAQLETLAYAVYRRPLAVLFRDEPPAEPPAGQEFRNLPGPAANRLSTEMRLAIRKAKHFQKLMGELGEEEQPRFAGFSLTLHEKPTQAAARFREFIGLTVEEQKRWTVDDAFARFRDYVERQGIFVLLMDLPLEEARAFSLSDAQHPLIVISKQDAKNARVFSLFHEVCHVLLRVSGILTSENLGDLSAPQRRFETYCDHFAAAFLLPHEAFLADLNHLHVKKGAVPDMAVDELGKRFKVSREAVYRKLTDLGYVPEALYFARRAEWNQAAIAAREERKRKARDEGRGGIMPVDQKTVQEKGKSYINRVMAGYSQGKITYRDLSDYLEVKVEHLPNILDRLR